MNTLIAAFRQYFRLVHADNPQLLHEVFRLRYQIYCVEAQLRDPSRCPQQLESDEYDRRSVHILLQHRPSGYFVGTVRLVLADRSDPEKPFPIEEIVPVERDFAGVSRQLRRQVAEISRMAILHHFPHHEPRRAPRYGEQAALYKHRGHRLGFPQPMLALAAGIVLFSVEHKITHWCAVMAPGLDRLLRQFSLNLQIAGPAFKFYGLRRPHFDSMQNVLDRAYCQHPEVWELITDCGRLWPKPASPR